MFAIHAFIILVSRNVSSRFCCVCRGNFIGHSRHLHLLGPVNDRYVQFMAGDLQPGGTYTSRVRATDVNDKSSYRNYMRYGFAKCERLLLRYLCSILNLPLFLTCLVWQLRAQEL